MKNIALIGYAGHAYVIYEIFKSMGLNVSAYVDKQENVDNPYLLDFLGVEELENTLNKLNLYNYFVSIGSNKIRERVSLKLISALNKLPENAMHTSAIISPTAKFGQGNMVGPKAVINAIVNVGNGVILNTACIIEHECKIGNYVHVAPGAILCGNVTVGNGTFIGAGAVIKEGIKIGENVIVGAGSVVVNNLESNITFVGNPSKKLRENE